MSYLVVLGGESYNNPRVTKFGFLLTQLEADGDELSSIKSCPSLDVINVRDHTAGKLTFLPFEFGLLKRCRRLKLCGGTCHALRSNISLPNVYIRIRIRLRDLVMYRIIKYLTPHLSAATVIHP
jgi:hypothetical protein